MLPGTGAVTKRLKKSMKRQQREEGRIHQWQKAAVGVPGLQQDLAAAAAGRQPPGSFWGGHSSCVAVISTLGIFGPWPLNHFHLIQRTNNSFPHPQNCPSDLPVAKSGEALAWSIMNTATCVPPISDQSCHSVLASCGSDHFPFVPAQPLLSGHFFVGNW